MKEQYVLYLYSAAAFRQEVLPAVNNADYAIALSSEHFGFQDDVMLAMEVMEERWHMHWKGERQELHNRDLIKLRLPGGEILSIMVLVAASAFHVCKKYQLQKERPVGIGSEKNNQICYNAFQLVSGSHGAILHKEGRYYIEDRSINGIYVNGKRIPKQEKLEFGDCIDIFGLRIVYLGHIIAVWGHVGELQPVFRLKVVHEAAGEISVTLPEAENRYLHRSPRPWRALEKKCIEIAAPAVPREQGRQSLILTLGPTVTMVFPLLISLLISRNITGQSSGSYLYMGLSMAVATALLGLFWGLLNYFFQKRQRKWEEKRRRAVYKDYLKEVEQHISEQYNTTRQILHERYPLPVLCSDIAKVQSGLWNRNPEQEDFLFQRLGVGEQPFQMEIRIPPLSLSLSRDDLRGEPQRIQREYACLHQVPLCVDLKKHRIIGITGGKRKKGAVALLQDLLLQIAINHSYAEVKIAFIYQEENRDMSKVVQLVKWMPHIWSEGRKMRYLAGNRSEAGEVFCALNEIFTRPMNKHYIIFIENQAFLEGELLNRFIIHEEIPCRLTSIFIEEAMEDMPNGCRCFIRNDPYFAGIIEDNNERPIQFDRINEMQAGSFTRMLLRIKVKESEGEGELVDYVPFLSLLPPMPIKQYIMDRWRKNRINDSLRVPIGQKAGGSILYLDLHEKYHGPHGLIAGTTGSGKSEALQTYLLSLAMHFSPEDAAFFIIDYKGGGMGNLFREIPHTVGTISNLSGNQIRRALISIKSEIYKRQQLFNQYGINHINQLTASYKSGVLDTGMAHLFIVVDEFAELKCKEPEFMRELVSVAQVGRSLGIHLILATQKPAGVVDDNIWSNARFRLCLRVQDRQDSMDMLHRPDAAYLTGAGRCYLQVGNDELFELFQTAYSGAVYREDSGEDKQNARMISATGKEIPACCYRGQQAADDDRQKISQMDKILACLKEAGDQMGYGKRHQLWMPLLPNQLYLEEIAEERQYPGHLYACPGLCDDPGNQRQFPLYIDLMQWGNLLICGGPSTGKSILLQTLLYSVMDKYSPRDVFFYLIDYSSRMLHVFADMPHTAGVACEEEDKVGRIFHRLQEELKRRKSLFAGGSFVHKKDQGENIPAVILAIDNYGGFRAHIGEKFDAQIQQLTGEGKNIGIYVILAAAGIGMGEVPGKLAGNFNYRIALEMGDKYQYSEIMRVSRPAVFPEEGKKGRGIIKEGDSILEFQTAMVLEEENDYLRLEKIKARALEKKEESMFCAETVPEIPKQPDFGSFLEQAAEKQLLWKEGRIPIGYEQESGNIYEITLEGIYCYLLSGKRGSGKTNLIQVIGHIADTKQAKTVWVDFSGRTDIKLPEAVQIIQNDAQLYRWLEDISPVLQERNQKLREGTAPQFSPIYVLIDDFYDFCRHIYTPEQGIEPMGDFMEHIWQKGSGHGLYWFAAWDPENDMAVHTYRGSQIYLGYGQGLHLGGNTAAQRIFSFDDLSYREQCRILNPGIAMIPPGKNRGTLKIIIPLLSSGKE